MKKLLSKMSNYFFLNSPGTLTDRIKCNQVIKYNFPSIASPFMFETKTPLLMHNSCMWLYSLPFHCIVWVCIALLLEAGRFDIKENYRHTNRRVSKHEKWARLDLTFKLNIVWVLDISLWPTWGSVYMRSECAHHFPSRYGVTLKLKTENWNTENSHRFLCFFEHPSQRGSLEEEGSDDLGMVVSNLQRFSFFPCIQFHWTSFQCTFTCMHINGSERCFFYVCREIHFLFYL